MDRQRKRNSNGEFINNSRNIQSGVTRSLCAYQIDNFSFRPEKVGEGITTPMVVVMKGNGAEWCLKVYPNGYNEESSGYVAAFLTLFKPRKANVKARFYILTPNAEEKNVSIVDEVVDLKKNNCCGCLRFVKKDFLHNRSNGLLFNDELTIVCEAEITELKSENHDSTETSVKNITTSHSQLPPDLGSTFDSHLLTDCILKVEDSEFKVHKAVLAAQSSTFCNIFNDTSENSQMNIIEIKDFRPEVVQGMLDYIYKDEVSNVRNMASEMLAIAAEYELDRLKAVAVECLRGDLTVENLCERLILSEKFSSKELEGSCQQFIFDNAENLRKTRNLEEIFKNHPSLAESLFWKSLNTSSTSNNNAPKEESGN
uniref:BTB domain-containing protein n=1 Tax=Strongyloides papillosus TaxID=174720 RepID=A0A0N5C3N5_STREA